MLIGEHVETARHFLSAADSELASGDVLQGCEKLWGAASHALLALAQTRVWRYGGHGAMRRVVNMIAAETGDDDLITGFKTAEKFHANFYHGFMEAGDEFDSDRQRVRDFVNRILALIDADNGADTDMGE